MNLCPVCHRFQGPKHREICTGPALQPVRSVAETIVDPDGVWTDEDARRVARAYLAAPIAGPFMGTRE